MTRQGVQPSALCDHRPQPRPGPWSRGPDERRHAGSQGPDDVRNLVQSVLGTAAEGSAFATFSATALGLRPVFFATSTASLAISTWSRVTGTRRLLAIGLLQDCLGVGVLEFSVRRAERLFERCVEDLGDQCRVLGL